MHASDGHIKQTNFLDVRNKHGGLYVLRKRFLLQFSYILFYVLIMMSNSKNIVLR